MTESTVAVVAWDLTEALQRLMIVKVELIQLVSLIECANHGSAAHRSLIQHLPLAQLCELVLVLVVDVFFVVIRLGRAILVQFSHYI